MIKVSVIPSQRKVIATLNNCEADAFYTIRKRLPQYIEIDAYMFMIKPAYKAIVKCHPDDEFDAAIGEEIARKRVIAKYNRDMARLLKKVSADLRESVSKIEAVTEVFEG